MFQYVLFISGILAGYAAGYVSNGDQLEICPLPLAWRCVDCEANTNTTSTSYYSDNDDDGVQEFLTGGVNVSRTKEYRHAVSIQEYVDGSTTGENGEPIAAGWYHVCSGTLIDVNKVITAAHCVDAYKRGHPETQYRVGLNFTTLTHGSGPYTYIEYLWKLKKEDNRPFIIFHKDYDVTKRSDPDQPGDLAIMIIRNHIVWKKQLDLGKVKVHKPGYNLDRKKCYVAGWGHPSVGSVPLQAARVAVMPNDLCEKNLRVDSDARLHPENVCAISYEGLSSGCKGDAGAGLICNKRLAGVLSFGLLTCNGCVPDVYVRASAHNRWIEKIRKRKDLRDKRMRATKKLYE